jgi:hypothetical protein
MLIVNAGFAFGQSSVRIDFRPMFNGKELVQDKKYWCEAIHDSVSVSMLRFYISGIEFLKNGKSVAKEAESYHLVDLADSSTLSINCKLNKNISFNEIKFNLGIDSATNVSGVMGGDLDPTKGMYWTWQSGYINFKIEGTANKCTARNHEFQFHLGGYLSPDLSMQKMDFACKNSSGLKFNVNVDRFFSGMDLSNTDHVMIPGAEAVELSKKAAGIFSIVN